MLNSKRKMTNYWNKGKKNLQQQNKYDKPVLQNKKVPDLC